MAHFNPRSSYEERHNILRYIPTSPLFQSTLLIRGATEKADTFTYTLIISIHAPHTRSDGISFRKCQRPPYFNPRSSYEERQINVKNQKLKMYFNPRSSYEERPFFLPLFCPFSVNFNPRSSYEERQKGG